jgi:H+/gluconate symporter-like permease
MWDNVLLIASILTALTAIIATVIKVYKFVRKCEKWIEKKDKHDEAQYRDILRLIIMTPEMPLSERINAGDIYVNKLNGNGGVKQKYLELLDKFAEEHKE